MVYFWCTSGVLECFLAFFVMIISKKKRPKMHAFLSDFFL